jgi:hypothetical protein
VKDEAATSGIYAPTYTMHKQEWQFYLINLAFVDYAKQTQTSQVIMQFNQIYRW